MTTDLTPPSTTHRDLRHIRLLSFVLDNALRIPGTNMRIGIDALLGLVPGVGDALGAAFSFYIILQAARLGATRATLVRMGFNVLVETAVGTIPLLGDLFDFAWKANARNVALLEQQIAVPEQQTRSDRRFVALVIVAILAAVGAMVFFATWISLLVIGLLS